MNIWFLGNPGDNHTVKWTEYFKDGRFGWYWFYIVPLKSKLLNILFNAGRLRKDIKQGKPDILHSLYAGTWGMIGALSGFHPFVLTAFGSDILINSKSWWKRQAIKFQLRQADYIICNGEPLKRKMIELGADPKKIRFIYWGQDPEEFKPLKVKKYFPTIISLRNLEPVYNIETLIRAVPLVLKEFPKAKFIIAGKGNEDYKSVLIALAEHLGVINNVKFVGWISEDMIVKWLNAITLYVSTSLSDGDLSQSTQQAMLCEVPVIVTNIEVNRIADGVFFPPKDFKILAKAIIDLLKDKELRQRLGKAGRQVMIKKRNWFKEMKKAENLYQEICQKEF